MICVVQSTVPRLRRCITVTFGNDVLFLGYVGTLLFHLEMMYFCSDVVSFTFFYPCCEIHVF